MDIDISKERLVNEQLRARNITDERVLRAFRTVDRSFFVPEELKERAYEDNPLPIGQEQTISQPFIVAYMIEKLQLSGREKVLEIGTGSGYQTALLAELSKQVLSVERSADLAEKAKQNLKNFDYTNIKIFVGDGSKGLSSQAPFDAIIVSAAAPEVPQPLIDQLSENARLIIPVGERTSQALFLLKKKDGNSTRETLISCVFVPLLGEYGWPRQFY